MKIFIHIGDSRTGTTTLQSFLTENSAKLLELGIHYPRLPSSHKDSTAQHLLAFSLLDEWPAFAIKAKKPREQIWDELKQYIDGNMKLGGRLLISSEAFSSAGQEQIGFVKKTLSEHDVTPIFVKRDIEDWRRSMREQRIRRGFHEAELGGPAKYDLGAKKLANWANYFDVKVIHYSRNVISDIMAFLDINDTDFKIIENLNAQPPEGTIELLNTLNKIPMEEKNRVHFNETIFQWLVKHSAK
ncbi:hypothetical protein [Ruixingdingia sedimenti]|uniref:Stf0 sulfotransferase n=1 Tax=Ruixingdingia sedimenti TaxID=3073604 RepID=A0ABU1FDU3_9RHOB|nr:hypothetical protein [Xinfangfangia sp. LG-4]MDR5655069.1 hypothetical protein [Xinfangfangia sp. LG-4]